MSKKLVLILLTLAILVFFYWAYQQRGALPAVLPPAAPGKANIIANELGLKLAPGLAIDIFAKDLGKPRDLEFTADGTLLVSVPSDGKVLALPDKNGDGTADEVKDILADLNNPHGLAFYNNQLFVAQETGISRYSWDPVNLSAKLDKYLFDLPKGGRHFTRTIAFDSSGKMYVSIGSSCDVCFENDPFLASVIVSDADGVEPKLFAKGLRNAVFITVNKTSGKLWGTEMGRDFLGDSRPSDEINIISLDKDYGWPLCWGNRVHDTDFDKKVYIQIIPQPPCSETEPPVYEICAHCAPLGLAFIDSPRFPREWQGDLLVAYHGSWNSTTPVGYKVVRLKVDGEKISGEEDFISGFLPEQGSQAIGRPVDLTFSKDGSLYLSDDKAGAVYRVRYQD